MPLGNSLIHPLLMASLRQNFMPSQCAIYDTDDSQNTVGETIRVKQALPLAGHERIQCNISQVLGRGADFSEQRAPDSTYVAQQRECQLDGYYTLIEEDMIAVVGGVEYDIRGVKQSSVQSHTVLLLEQIR